MAVDDDELLAIDQGFGKDKFPTTVPFRETTLHGGLIFCAAIMFLAASIIGLVNIILQLVATMVK